VLDGERTFTARAGDFVVIPPGTLHRFRNPGVDAARMLILFTPAGIEGFFFEAGEAARPGEPAPQWAPDEIQRPWR
jgi:quercetin dioxygenase-like cupin family protein